MRRSSPATAMAALKELGERSSDGGGGGGGGGSTTDHPTDPANGYLLRTDANERTMHPGATATAISLPNAANDADASGPLLAAPVPVVVNFGGPGMATKTTTNLSPAQQQSYGAGTVPDRHRKRSSGSTTVRSPLATGGKAGPPRSITPGRGLFGPRLAGAFRRPTVLGGTMLLVGVLLGVLLVFLIARVHHQLAGPSSSSSSSTPYCGGVLELFGRGASDTEHRTGDRESWRRQPGHNICLTDECVRTGEFGSIASPATHRESVFGVSLGGFINQTPPSSSFAHRWGRTRRLQNSQDQPRRR